MDAQVLFRLFRAKTAHSHTAITSIVVAFSHESAESSLRDSANAESKQSTTESSLRGRIVDSPEAIQQNKINPARSANPRKTFCFVLLLQKVESPLPYQPQTTKRRKFAKSSNLLATLFFAIFTQIAPLSADESFALNKNHGITILSENDAYFEPLIKSDEYYTAGHYISYLSPEFTDSWINKIAAFSHLYDKHFSRFSIALKQEIYTPDKKYDYDFTPPTNDILFGAALYANLSFVSRTRDFMEQFSVDIGIVGPYAFGKQVQNGVHRITNNREALGWNVGALKSEILVNLHYGLIWRWVFIEDFFDVLPQFQISLGNAYTAASAGIKFRMGYGIKNDFGAQKLKSRFAQNIVDDGLKIYGVFGFGGSVVGRDMFVEGNTAKSAPKSPVTINRFLYEVEVGAMIGWKYVSFGYIWTSEYPRFREQNGHHKYGSLRLEIMF